MTSSFVSIQAFLETVRKIAKVTFPGFCCFMFVHYVLFKPFKMLKSKIYHYLCLIFLSLGSMTWTSLSIDGIHKTEQIEIIVEFWSSEGWRSLGGVAFFVHSEFLELSYSVLVRFNHQI